MSIDITDNFISNGRLPIPLPWTSDVSGDAVIDIPYYKGFDITAVLTAPGANGDLTNYLPTDLYDVVINNSVGEDIMHAELVDCSGSVAKTIYALPPIQVPSKLQAVISVAGNAKQGIIVLFLTKIK